MSLGRLNPAARRRVLVWGVGWGLIVTIIQPLTFFPLESFSISQLVLWALTYWAVPLWCLTGCAMVWVAERSQRANSRTALVTGYLCVSLFGSMLNPLIAAGIREMTRELYPSVEQFAVMVDAVPPTSTSAWLSVALYDLWVMLFYGALLIAVDVLTFRAEQTRFLLHASEMARSRTEELLDSARLDALERQIDPSLLLNTMRELETHYRSDPSRADHLLEALVEFLRSAMRGLRERTSTVHTELHLARAYSQLQRERGIGGVWRIEDQDGASRLPVQFPSLLMLQLLALGSEGAHPSLTVRASDGTLSLLLRGLARSPPADLQTILRAQLRALYGEHFKLETDSPGLGSLTINLPTVKQLQGV